MSGPLLTANRAHISVAAARRARRRAGIDPHARVSRHGPRTRAVQTSAPSLLILGADAVLAAQPATPVQLAHACLAAGFDQVIPSSWGDELVAEHVVSRLQDAELPAIQCSCPRVARRLATHGDVIASMLLRVVPPPVALARQLRAMYAPVPPQVTFVGACPAGSDSSIDTWMTPEELFVQLDRRGITPTLQPTAFDSILPPDRRRHWSDAGGLPYAGQLRAIQCDVREIASDDFVPELADLLLSHDRLLLDIALSAGCSCSGVTAAGVSDDARIRLRHLEPPRAASPVVEMAASLRLDDDATLLPEPSAQMLEQPPKLAHVESRSDAATQDEAVAMVSPVVTPRRSPPGVPRPVFGTMPLTRSDSGRQLPRAYIARRRSSPRGVRLDQSQTRARGTRAEVSARRRLLLWGAAVGVGAGLSIAWLLRVLY